MLCHSSSRRLARSLVLPLGLAAALAAPSSAQVQPGDVLVNQFSPGALHHYRADGTLVRTITGTGSQWIGASITHDGDFVVSRRDPVDGMNVYDGETGVEILSVDLPTSGFAQPSERLHDGTYVYTYSGPDALHLDANGVPIGVIPTPGMGTINGTVVDSQGHLWLASPFTRTVIHYDTNFGVLDSWVTTHDIADIDIAPDGTVWLADRSNDRAVQYQPDGTLITAIPVSSDQLLYNTAVAPDGSILTGGFRSQVLERHSPTGTLLGTLQLGSTVATIQIDIAGDIGGIGVAECSPAVANSTGSPAELTALGTILVAQNQFSLRSTSLPPNTATFFLNARDPGFVANPGGSQGNLCLSGTIGRHYNLLGASDSSGNYERSVDLTALPRPTGTVTVLAGETWRFQGWYRDANPTLTSNFTNGIAVTFQ